MERKAKTGLSARMIVAIVFTGIGAGFLPIGIVAFLKLADIDTGFIAFAATFAGLGIVFLVLGITFLVFEIKRRNRCNRLLNEGYYILAEVLEINMNTSIEYGNNNHPYIVKCKYTDENGTIHIFKSRNIKLYPGDDLIGQQVRVYLDRSDYNNYKNYYLDIDEILPRVVEH